MKGEGRADLPGKNDSRVDEAVKQYKSVMAIEAQRDRAWDRLNELVAHLSGDECAEYVQRTGWTGVVV